MGKLGGKKFQVLDREFRHWEICMLEEVEGNFHEAIFFFCWTKIGASVYFYPQLLVEGQ